MVTGQAERAKQLERNLPDGAQQQLVSLGVQLASPAEFRMRVDPEMAETLAADPPSPATSSGSPISGAQ